MAWWVIQVGQDGSSVDLFRRDLLPSQEGSTWLRPSLAWPCPIFHWEQKPWSYWNPRINLTECNWRYLEQCPFMTWSPSRLFRFHMKVGVFSVTCIIIKTYIWNHAIGCHRISQATLASHLSSSGSYHVFGKATNPGSSCGMTKGWKERNVSKMSWTPQSSNMRGVEKN